MHGATIKIKVLKF